MADLSRSYTRQHRRRNEAVVHGLRHERDHWTSAARRARRVEAGASPRAVRDEDDGAVGNARLPQVRQDRRRGDGQLPSARRRLDLRHARPAGAGLQHALPARRRPGQLRLGRRRSAGGDAVHGGAAASRWPTTRWRDLDKETVDFAPNYDETTEEPTVLPAPFPNLLVNGSAGIAVGMATNMPPHNLREVIDGCIWLIETAICAGQDARTLAESRRARSSRRDAEPRSSAQAASR